MKPKNFPGRVNKRRKAAQARLKKAGKTDTQEYNTLTDRIVGDEAARFTHTKKNRTK